MSISCWWSQQRATTIWVRSSLLTWGKMIQIWATFSRLSNAYDTKAGCQIPLRDSQKGRVAANLQPLPTCQIYTCFIESGPPHLKCTTLILPALPLTSLFAWKPPHAVAGINSSNLGGHSNASVRTKLAPLAPGLHENLHRFAPSGHLLAATIYCQKCQFTCWAAANLRPVPTFLPECSKWSIW